MTVWRSERQLRCEVTVQVAPRFPETRGRNSYGEVDALEIEENPWKTIGKWWFNGIEYGGFLTTNIKPWYIYSDSMGYYNGILMEYTLWLLLT